MLTLSLGSSLETRLLLAVRSGNFVMPCERMHCENSNATELADPPGGLDGFEGEVALEWVPVEPSCAT
jgi:hypothetical protein